MSMCSTSDQMCYNYSINTRNKVMTIQHAQRTLYVFNHLNDLIGLKLVHSQINDVKILGSLTTLTRLKLRGNEIVDIKPLASLNNLQRLDLADNQISDIRPLASLTNLIVLRLANNRISSEDMNWLRKKLPNCRIFPLQHMS